jgi:hypothetical protein
MPTPARRAARAAKKETLGGPGAAACRRAIPETVRENVRFVDSAE